LKKIVAQIRKSIRNRKSKIQRGISKTRKNLNARKKKLDMTAIKNFIIFTFSYGFLINYVLRILLEFKMSIFTIPAWGIFYYFIREELVDIIKKIIRR